MKLSKAICALGLVAAVAGCSQRETILPGERLSPRAAMLAEEGLAPEAAPADQALPISLPGVVANAEWPQRAGSATHSLFNAAIGSGNRLVWSADIGAGNARRYRITADPIVGAGRVYTLDSQARVTATATNGGRVWQTDITPPGDRAADASGGGVAYANGTVYVTSDFAELVAIDAATGAIKWRQYFDAGIGGAPTVRDGTVYVVARDSSAWAIRASDGKVIWQVPGAPSNSGMTGVSAPVVTDRMVIFPFPSGFLAGVLRQSGMQLWQSKVPGARPGVAYASIVDLTGDPVVVGDTVYAGSSAGKLAAFDVNSGERIWTSDMGANSPVQVAGGSIFLTSDSGQIVRLDVRTGQQIWAKDLPYYTKDKPKRQRNIVASYGPVLAGGKLFVASSDGVLRIFSPVDGSLIGQAQIPGGASTDPVVAGRTLYVVGGDGKLHAFQ
ncbi:PQQ-binding-like beta-propeller repeat protein [Thioclava atlantica]|uniref:PQQ enzyme repeat family protein n=1 Tax=Thioclava atlantica TaxID=1317124 RepID=A0A085U1X2_9RHOB|nr:PQQ-binding-like beta-propeller repeat protein [Thioclava atlantica]KFE36969.1 PQQ enzyme repeat family protein [Thioclava atlantica]